jgi:hypothetical protein
MECRFPWLLRSCSDVGIERIFDVANTRRVETPGCLVSVVETERVEAPGCSVLCPHRWGGWRHLATPK